MKKQSEISEIMRLKDDHAVEEFTPYHYRVDGILDLYPVRGRFHNVRTQKRGSYPRGMLASFVDKQIDSAQSVPAKPPKIAMAAKGTCSHCGQPARFTMCEKCRDKPMTEIIFGINS